MTDLSMLPPVFHSGETTLHKTLGLESKLTDLGKHMIRDHMPQQHQVFFAQLPWVHLGAVDSQGHPWALIRTGAAGFMDSPDNQTLTIKSLPLPGEPLDIQLSSGSKVSIVGLEPSTRRRNRLNATVASNSDKQLTVSVDQSYGNCPKYIQQRNTQLTTTNSTNDVSVHNTLEQTDTAILKSADTLFIASRAQHFSDDPRNGVDINHRGGLPGFVEIINDTVIQIPDYKGNNFFNTFGNILLEPRVGIQVIDFASSTLLNLQGCAEILTVENTELTPPDMGRRLRVIIESITRSTGAFPYKLSDPDYSPYL